MTRAFEELPVWKAGRDLVHGIYRCTRSPSFSQDPGLCDQIQRASVSVTSNIAEGHERGTTAELVQFLFYAKGSAGEVRSQLYHAEDLGYVSPAAADQLRTACLSISRQLSAWIKSMQTPGFKQGPKYHKEPDQAWDRFVKKAGLVRMPDGRFVRATEDGTRKEEEGKRKREDGNAR